MSTDTQTFERQQDSASNIFGVSVRAWVTLALVLGVVSNQVLVTAVTLFHALKSGDLTQVGPLTTIGEPFYTLASIAVGFYFGQKLTSKA